MSSSISNLSQLGTSPKFQLMHSTLNMTNYFIHTNLRQNSKQPFCKPTPFRCRQLTKNIKTSYETSKLTTPDLSERRVNLNNPKALLSVSWPVKQTITSFL